MLSAPHPFDENLRLQELISLDILDTAPEPEFDDLAQLAAQIANAPVALVSLVDADRQWFKACVGLPTRQTSRTVSFCAHAIFDDGVMWVEDARRDIRFADNPLVAGPPGIRFYAGAPITVRDSKIGTLCVIDSKPKAWNEALARQLETLAKIVADRLEARRELQQRTIPAKSARQAIIDVDDRGIVAAWNPSAERLFGLAANDALGQPFTDVLAAAEVVEQRRDDRQFQLLIAEVNDYAIYMLDARGRVISWNAGAARIKGYSAEEIIGQSFSVFYSNEDRAAGKPKKALRRALATGRFEDEGWRVRKDGSRLWTSVVIDAIYDDGQFVGFAKITRDITERHEADATLKLALQHAEDANRAKSEFLANMSHEIRTPLNGVVGVADMLAQAELPPAQHQMAEIIASSAKNLEQLLGDILDLARIESGQVVMAPEPFNLVEMTHAMAGLARLNAEGKDLQFNVDDRLPAGTSVVADKFRIQQILTNLLSNAVKFTERGEVTLKVRLDTDAEGESVCTFEVRDTGVGFDPSNKALVFDRFSQADGSITRRFGGTGLGMAISRQLADMMDAELDCDSRPGVGSVFVLRVPVQLCDTPAGRQDNDLAPAHTGPAPERALQVLLVDDHPTNRKVCELILRQINAEVTSVENGALALEAFDAAIFDVIFMDMQMPVMDGVTAVRHIRERERRSGMVRTPVFMLTANALVEHIEDGRLAGADMHLSKPITSASIFGAIAMLADMHLESRAIGDEKVAV